MDNANNIEKSNNSSFEDLSNLNENELKEAAGEKPVPAEEVIDVIGNGKLLKKVIKR